MTDVESFDAKVPSLFECKHSQYVYLQLNKHEFSKFHKGQSLADANNKKFYINNEIPENKHGILCLQRKVNKKKKSGDA